MKILLIEDDLKNEQLKSLIDFISLNSDKISLSRRYSGKISGKEFNEIQEEYRKLLLKEDKIRRENYKNNINGYKDRIDQWLSSKEEIEEYFNDILNQDLEVYESLDYEEFKCGYYKGYKSKLNSFIESRFTRSTFVTNGPLFEVCYFKLDEDIIKETLKLKSLFDYPIYLEDIEFEDLTFYKDDEVIFGICSHENFANIILEDEDYKEFFKLNINHKI